MHENIRCEQWKEDLTYRIRNKNILLKKYIKPR